MKRIVEPADGLKARLGPSKTSSSLGTMPGGSTPDVVDVKDGWARFRVAVGGVDLVPGADGRGAFAYCDASFLGTDAQPRAAPWPALGMNCRGLAWYGTPALPYSHASDTEATIAALRQMGVKVVRFFAPYRKASPVAVAAQVRDLLDKLARAGLCGIVALGNEYGDTPFSVAGDDGYYSGNYLTVDWLLHGYRDNYLPMVSEVVSRCAGHAGLAAWEVGNEITIGYPHEERRPALVSFVADVSGLIHTLDAVTPVAGGFMSSVHAGPNNQASWDADFSDVLHRHLDIVTLHWYDQTDRDRAWQELAHWRGRKPVIVDEFGISGDQRSPLLQQELDRWYGAGAGLLAQWGFMPGQQDSGDGDQRFGMDRLWHHDYDALAAVYRAYAAKLTPTPEPAAIAHYGQRDSRWSQLALGFGDLHAEPHPQNIYWYGCKLCCHAGLRGVTPDVLNDEYRRTGRFSGDLIPTQTVNGWTVVYESDTYAGIATPPGELARLTNHLADGNPAIVMVDSTPNDPRLDTHFVIAERLDATGRVLVWDPWWAETADICKRYGSTLASAVWRFIAYRR